MVMVVGVLFVPRNVASAKAESATSVLELDSHVLSSVEVDTLVNVGEDFLRVEWVNCGSFRPPYYLTNVTESGDTLFTAQTRETEFCVYVSGLEERADLSIESSNGRNLKVHIENGKSFGFWHLYLILTVLGAAIIALVWWYYRRQRMKLEKKRQELEEANTRHTHKYESATVLFADIEGFTKITAHMNQDQLVDELDRYFIYFDELVDRYSVEKIKTIGDCYMCAGGVPDADSANPIEVVLVGLGMIEYVKERRATNEGFWNIRVGINTGSVISGRLGNIKKVFDIWGDTVNTASRMESSSEPGRVNISESTYQQIEEYFECEPRGKMPVKYKGEIVMYFVNRLKEEFCIPGSTCKPNALLMRKLQILRISDFENKVRESILKNYHQNIGKRFSNLLVRVRTLSSMEKFTDDEIVVSSVASIFIFVRKEFPRENYLKGKEGDECMRRMHISDDLHDRIAQVVVHVTQKKVPEDRVEEVIMDAFNEPYGRKDIVPLLLANYEDVVARGTKISRNNWISKRRTSIENYSFYSESAKKLCEVPKRAQVEIVEELLTL